MEKYKDCPYYNAGSYQTKPIECDFCGYICRMTEDQIKVKYDRYKNFVWHSWCVKCKHSVNIDPVKRRIPTMVQNRLIETVNCFEFVHLCKVTTYNQYASADVLSQCSSHPKCWHAQCNVCNVGVHVRETDMPSKVTSRLKKKISPPVTNPPAKSPYGLDIVY